MHHCREFLFNIFKKIMKVSEDLLKFADGINFSTVVAGPPWQFKNRTWKVASEHKRHFQYPAMILGGN